MPVTGRLSSKFYERLGDEVTNELVDWMNAVDVSYQTQMREMNDLFWQRLSASLKSEMASLREDLRAELRMNTASLRAEFNGGLADVRTELNAGRAENRAELSATRGEVRSDAAGLRTEMATAHAGLATLRGEMSAMRGDLLKWMFVYWTGTVVTIGGLIVGLRIFGSS